jgi:hypothetical protein
MIDTDIRRAIVFKRSLIAAYVGVAIVSGIGLARGWSNSSAGVLRQLVSCLILALCAATLFVQNTQGNQRPFAVFDILKSIACMFGALAWLVIAIRIVPETSLGSVMVMIPTMGLFLCGMYYLSGPFSSMWRAATAVWLKSETLPLPVPYQESPPSNLLNSVPDRLEVAVNYAAIAGRFFAGIFLVGAFWWLFERDSGIAAIILGLVGLLITHHILRMVLGHGPGLVMTNEGLSIRRGIGTVTDLRWADITTIELKASMGATALVIGVRHPDSLLARYKGYTRWSMRRTQEMFGGPVRVRVFALKCNGQWLAQKASAYVAKFGRR